MAEDKEGVFGVDQPIPQKRKKPATGPRLRKGAEVGGAVRVVHADGQAPLPAFAGPDWNIFKTELAKFLAMDAPNPFVTIRALTPNDKRAEWDRHRQFHKDRVINPDIALSAVDRAKMEGALEQEIEYFRAVLRKQSTPLIALQSAIEDTQAEVQTFLGAAQGSIAVVGRMAEKMDQSLADVLLIVAIKEIATKWNLSETLATELLNKHVFQKDEGPAALVFPRRPKP